MSAAPESAREAHALIAVWLHVAADREEEFNDWYELEHLSQVTNLEGFICARRYSAEDGSVPKFLAWYEVQDAGVETAPPFQDLVAHPTGWSQRMRRFYGENRIRNNYRLVISRGTAPVPDAPFLYVVQTDCAEPAREKEFFDWYDGEHLPALAAAPGVLRARRYEAVSGSPGSMAAYELASRDIFESPGWLDARLRSRTDEMSVLFAPGRRAMYRLIRPTLWHEAKED